MKEGFFPIYSPSQRHYTRHLFRAGLSMCGGYLVLEADVLEAERLPGLRYCSRCLAIVADELKRGLAPEPALSEDEKDFIEQHWATLSSAQIAQALGRQNVKRVTYYAKRVGGPKQIPNAGRFSAGRMPHNWKPEQTEFVRKDSRGVPYLHVRGGKFGFQYKHVAVWTAANGPLPEGHCVAFIDGDTLNCNLDNLELITRTENLERNSGRKELTDTYVAKVLARTSGQRGMHIDPILEAALLENPEILEVKRNQLRLKRALKTATNP